MSPISGVICEWKQWHGSASGLGTHRGLINALVWPESMGVRRVSTWTSFNLPSQINSGASYSQFTYGPDRQRWKHVANAGGSIETTISIGGLFDKVTRGTTVDYRHYIPVADGNVIRTVRVAGATTTLHTYYSSSDHLGSADVVTDESGAVIVRESFAPFGARRGSNWTGAPTTTEMNAIAAISRDGFTGHEMLDSVGLVHMNGRVYDQATGRFISADPYVQDPFDSQSLNRYSYVGNNPLSYTDPSGFFKLKDFFDPSSKKNPHRYITGTPDITRAIDRFMLKNPKWQQVASAASSVNAWSSMGVNAHLARIRGASNQEVVLAGALGYLAGFLNNTFKDLFVPVGLGPGFYSPSGKSGGTGWVANHGIGGSMGLNSTVGAAVENLDQKAQALRALSDLEAVMLARIKQNPSAAISMSAQELGVLFEGTYFQTLDQPRHANFSGGWNEPSVMAQFAVADTFLYSPEFTSRQLNVNGQLVWGGHVNYIAVGMLAAHYGPNMYQSIPALVAAHNIGQVAGRHGQGVRNLKDIAPGTRWALMGADFYNRRRRVVVR